MTVLGYPGRWSFGCGKVGGLKKIYLTCVYACECACCTHHTFFIHSFILLMDLWGSFHHLIVVNIPAMATDIQMSISLLSVLLGIHRNGTAGSCVNSIFNF